MLSRFISRFAGAYAELLESRRLLSEVVIEGVLPAAMDLPRINAVLRRTPTSDPLEAPGLGYIVQAYFDSGTSGMLLSKETADWLGVTRQTVGGTPAMFYDVGVAGPEPFEISEPLYISLANFGSAVTEPELSDFTHMTGPVRTQISMLPADDFTGPLDIFGMPMFAGNVVVMDPRPLVLGDIDYIHTFIYDPGTPYHPETDATDPGIPPLDYHIQLSYGDFGRFTFVDPEGAQAPALAGNPFIGPDPVRRMDDPTFDDGTPPVTITMGASSVSGSFLLDTGAMASFISQDMAGAVGVHYRAGTYGGDEPVLEDALGNIVANQFSLVVGGIGGAINVAGFYLDRLVLPTQEGNDLLFEGAPVLVLDVTVEDATTGQTLTLDGDIGLNYLVASMDVVNGEPVAFAAGAFDWITLDQPGATLGLAMSSFEVPAPEITGISTDTGAPGDFITSDRTLSISGSAHLLTTITLYRDGQLIGQTDVGFEGTWMFDYSATSLPDGVYEFTATETSLLGQVSPHSAPLVVTVDGTSPTVSTIRVNDGNAQRSMINSLTITFAENVTLASAVQLTTSRGEVIPGLLLSITNPSGDAKTYVVEFSGTAATGGSLPDGMFRAIVSAAGVSDLAGNAMTANYSSRFHRLFGDVDGDRDVDRSDLAVFKSALNRPAKYVWWLDYNSNTLINNSDYLEFRKRLTKPLLV